MTPPVRARSSAAMRATVHPMKADRGANEMASLAATLRSLLMEWCPRRRQARRRHSGAHAHKPQAINFTP